MITMPSIRQGPDDHTAQVNADAQENWASAVTRYLPFFGIPVLAMQIRAKSKRCLALSP